ncbi:MAG: type 4a pilus biogenesis protein PilO [Elusimicrobiota bacterium]
MAIQLSKQQQYLGAGAFLFVIGSIVYVKFFWLPISQKMSDLSEQIAQIDIKISKATAQASRLQRLQLELTTLKQQAVEAERRLPKTKSVPDVLITLSSLAQQNRVSIQNFSPGPQKSLPQQSFIELSYPMSVKGSYHNIGRFFAAVALEERIFNVRNVVFPAAGGEGEMTVTFTLLTYQYKG